MKDGNGFAGSLLLCCILWRWKCVLCHMWWTSVWHTSEENAAHALLVGGICPRKKNYNNALNKFGPRKLLLFVMGLTMAGTAELANSKACYCSDFFSSTLLILHRFVASVTNNRYENRIEHKRHTPHKAEMSCRMGIHVASQLAARVWQICLSVL